MSDETVWHEQGHKTKIHHGRKLLIYHLLVMYLTTYEVALAPAAVGVLSRKQKLARAAQARRVQLGPIDGDESVDRKPDRVAKADRPRTEPRAVGSLLAANEGGAEVDRAPVRACVCERANGRTEREAR